MEMTKELMANTKELNIIGALYIYEPGCDQDLEAEEELEQE